LEAVFLSLSNPRGGAVAGLTNATLIITNTPAIDGIRIVPAGTALVAESIQNGTLDSGETVTFNIGLRNAGVLDATSLGATLLSTNGITALTTSNYFGRVLAGGNTVSRPYQFRITATNGSRITLVLRLQDGSMNLGTVSFDMFVGSTSFTFSNTNGIAINDRATGSPYPSTIFVSGLNGTVAKVSVSLFGVSHTYPADIDIMLVGPQGESVVLLSDAGSTPSTPNPISNVNLKFDDDVGVFVSKNGPIVSGTYQPTNYTDEITGSADSWPAPVPANAPTRSRLLTPGPNIDPNGIWQLFVVDDAAGDVGSITGGWSVTITMSGSTSGTVGSASDIGVTTIASPNPTTYGQLVNYTLTATNYGPGRATGIRLTNVLDPGMVFVSAQGSYAVIGSNVVFNLPNLDSGFGTNALMTVRANPASPSITNTLFNTVSGFANESDVNSGNNSSTGKIIVFPIPSASISRKDNQLILSWPAAGGGIYAVEATDQLVPANWVRITATPALSGGMMNVTINPTSQARFYRIRPE